MQHKLIKGIVIGGLCSVISWDVSEILFQCLDPVAKACFGPASKEEEVGGPGNTSHVPRKGAQVSTSPAGGGDGSGNADRDKEKQVLMKRVLRILIFSAVAYGLVSYSVGGGPTTTR